MLQLKIIIRLPEKGFCSLWDHSILGQFGHLRRVAVGPPANARYYCSLLIVPPIYNRASIEKKNLFEIFLVEGMMYKMDEFVSNFPVH